MSTTALQAPQATNWESREMIETLKQTVAKGATDAQFKMFIEVCKATGLNPFLKEIWFVPNVGVMAGRDGYLRIANDHPMFDGMSTVVERDAEGIPIKATCSVWRKDRAHPITCEAFYNEYRKNSQVWTTYKSAMISKVAEVLALKRSFSINGIVTEEEIGEQKAQAQTDQQDVAQRRIAELNAEGKTQAVSDFNKLSPKTILELADDPNYEQRHTALILQANAVLDEAQAPAGVSGASSTDTNINSKGGGVEKPTRKRGTIAYKDLKAFKDMKSELLKIVGDDHEYYDMLKLQKVSHADELNAEQSKPTYKLMAERYKQLRKEREERDLLMEAQQHALRIGPRFTKEILDRRGLECIDDILNLGGTPLDELLQELRSTA